MIAARTRSIIVPLLAMMGATSYLLCAQSGTDSEQTKQQAAVLKKYDGDQDGRLSDAERETMRKEVFEQRRKDVRGGRGRMGFRFPPEIVEKYDKDGDGQLNEEESQTAQRGIQKMFQDLQKKYDANGNGRPDPEEMEKLQADGAAGKLEGVPRIFFGMGGRRGRGGGGRSSSGQEIAKQMDKDGDGRLSQQELAAAREKLQNRSQEPESQP